MAEITKVYSVTITGILVLTYDEDGDIPNPDMWDTSQLLDELTVTMHTTPSVKLALVHYNRDTEDNPDSKEAE